VNIVLNGSAFLVVHQFEIWVNTPKAFAHQPITPKALVISADYAEGVG
jgi:hypothetical protein